MPRSRLLKRPFSTSQRPNSIHVPTALAIDDPGLDAQPAKTQAPASVAAVSSMNGRSNAAAKHAFSRSVTIRSVPSYEGSETSPDSRCSVFASSVASTASASSAMPPAQHDKQRPPSPVVRPRAEPSLETPVKWSPSPKPSPQTHGSAAVLCDIADSDSKQWDSTIGKAGLGKTGRVINKLVSDNDALKRDIRLERIRAHEAKEAAKLIEDKMERVISDYEARLLEATVTKTLLTRKERQVATLTATVDAEKKKAADALEREKLWQLELEKVRAETALQIDEATSYALLMEGRYNAISSHWRDQGDDVKRVLSRLKGDIGSLVEERRSDDDKIQTLRELCDQQDSNIRQLRREKEDISRLFEEYKKTQEDDLRDIRLNAARREEEQERLLEESRQTLAKLNWAINVRQNVRDAQ